MKLPESGVEWVVSTERILSGPLAAGFTPFDGSLRRLVLPLDNRDGLRKLLLGGALFLGWDRFAHACASVLSPLTVKFHIYLPVVAVGCGLSSVGRAGCAYLAIGDI